MPSSSCRRRCAAVVVPSSCRRGVVVVVPPSSCRRRAAVVSSSCRRRRAVIVPPWCRRRAAVVVPPSCCAVVVPSSSCRRRFPQPRGPLSTSAVASSLPSLWRRLSPPPRGSQQVPVVVASSLPTPAGLSASAGCCGVVFPHPRAALSECRLLWRRRCPHPRGHFSTNAGSEHFGRLRRRRGRAVVFPPARPRVGVVHRPKMHLRCTPLAPRLRRAIVVPSSFRRRAVVVALTPAAPHHECWLWVPSSLPSPPWPLSTSAGCRGVSWRRLFVPLPLSSPLRPLSTSAGCRGVTPATFCASAGCRGVVLFPAPPLRPVAPVSVNQAHRSGEPGSPARLRRS